MSQQIKERFRTPYGERSRSHIPAGTFTEKTYGYKVDSYGRKILSCTGERDSYQEIQASLEETKIENILARALAGDNSVFRPDGIYADVADMPKNLIEARESIVKLENLWQSVPTEIKNKYNNNVEEFIGASGSEQWLKDMGLIGKNDQIEAATELKTPDKVSTLGQTEAQKGAENE